MSNSWEILGLDQDSASEKDAKKAYARLLKLHRPDQDPEGFRRVRDAYEQVLLILKNTEGRPQQELSLSYPEELELTHVESSNEDTTPAHLQAVWKHFEEQERRKQILSEWHDDVQPLPNEKVVSLTRENELPPTLAQMTEGLVPDEVEKALESFTTAMQKRSPLRRRWTLFLCLRAFNRHQVLPGTRARRLLRAVDWNLGTLAAIISDAFLLRQLKLNEFHLTLAVLDQWRTHQQVKRMDRFAKLLAKKGCQMASLDTVSLFVQLAQSSALGEPLAGGKLLDAIFPHLQPIERNLLLPQVEEQISRGKILRLLTKNLRKYWVRHLRGASYRFERHPWVLRFHWNKTLRTAPGDWAGWNFLVPTLPEKLANKTEKRIKWELWWRHRHIFIRMFRPQSWLALLTALPMIALVLGALMLLGFLVDHQLNKPPQYGPVEIPWQITKPNKENLPKALER